MTARAYRCAFCGAWVPREQHSATCPRSSNARAICGRIGLQNEVSPASRQRPGDWPIPYEEGATMAHCKHVPRCVESEAR